MQETERQRAREREREREKERARESGREKSKEKRVRETRCVHLQRVPIIVDFFSGMVCF